MPGLGAYRLDQYRIGSAGGSGNAQPSDVWAGKTFTNDDGEQVGTHPPDKKFASGSVTSSADERTFYIASNSAAALFKYITVTGLGFTPTRIKVTHSQGSVLNTTLYDLNFNFSYSYGDILLLYGISSAYEIDATGGFADVSNGSFVLPVAYANALYNWEAYE